MLPKPKLNNLTILVLGLLFLLLSSTFIATHHTDKLPHSVQKSINNIKDQLKETVYVSSDGGSDLTFAWPHLMFLYSLQQHERRIYSQNNEDGVLEYLFDNLGTTDKYYVEFGTQNGSQCNTRYLHVEYGWNGLLMDGDGVIDPDVPGNDREIKNEFITSTNIVSLFEKYDVPKPDFDLLSVDIDSNDYYVLKAILDSGYRPNVIVIEVNRNFGPEQSYTRENDDERIWDGDTYFGVSPLAVERLGNAFGYHFVYYDSEGVNGFLVKESYIADFLKSQTGLLYDSNVIKKLLPPFEFVYRRSLPLHIWRRYAIGFKKEFELDPWVKVNEDLTEEPTK